MMCLLTQINMPHIPFTPFGREIASLSSVRQFRLLPFGLVTPFGRALRFAPGQCMGHPNLAKRSHEQ